jgi:hypothetical protein
MPSIMQKNHKAGILGIMFFLLIVGAAQAWWTPYDHINLRNYYQIVSAKNISIGVENGSALLTISGNETPASNLSLNVTGNLYVNMVSGSVGINQSNPRAALEVKGDVMITENNTLFLSQSKKAYISFDGTKITMRVN